MPSVVLCQQKMSKRNKLLFKKCLKRVYSLLLEEVSEAIDEEENREPRVWVREWIKRRETHGASALLLRELATEDAKEYMAFLRLTPFNFDTLLDLVSRRIMRVDTQMRDALPPRIKLEITLCFLATGNNYRSLQRMFRVSRAAISRFVPEVCDAISDSLKEYFKTPNSEEEWRALGKGFCDSWNLPNCCGAIDGKHIMIKAPPNSGSLYYNYKGSHSVVLLAVVDFNYYFTYIEVGHKGSENDAGVFQNSSLWLPLENGLLPDGHFLVGDDAFPLKPYLMKPITKAPLNREDRIYNYRISRARRIVENGFGILVSRFRVFEGKLSCKVSVVPKLVKAACSIHNWLRKTSSATYFPPGSIDEEDLDRGDIIPGRWRTEISNLRDLERFGGRRTTKLAEQMRCRLKTYFNYEGAVPWQDKCM